MNKHNNLHYGQRISPSQDSRVAEAQIPASYPVFYRPHELLQQFLPLRSYHPFAYLSQQSPRVSRVPPHPPEAQYPVLMVPHIHPHHREAAVTYVQIHPYQAIAQNQLLQPVPINPAYIPASHPLPRYEYPVSNPTLQEQRPPPISLLPIQTSHTYNRHLINHTHQAHPPIETPPFEDRSVQMYPDITTYVNSNPLKLAPLVESVFNDQNVCPVCGRANFKSLRRHIKIHGQKPRLKCMFPKSICNFKTNTYNRLFDYKRHLINKHFMFNDKKVRKLSPFSDKLRHQGKCPCGKEFTADDWLSDHILTEEENERCPLFIK